MSILTYGLGSSGGGTSGYSQNFSVSLVNNNITGEIDETRVSSVFSTDAVGSVVSVRVNGEITQIVSDEISN